MFDRLNVLAVFRGHWKGLRDRKGNTILGNDLLTRGILVFGTAAVLVYSIATELHLKSPGILFAGLSLFSSALLAAFAQIASIRARFVVPDDMTYDDEVDTRNMLDEAVAHVLTAALLSATASMLIIVGIQVGNDGDKQLNVLFSTAIAAMGTYLFVLFVMTVRKLYAAYVVGNEVSKELSGHHRG